MIPSRYRVSLLALAISVANHGALAETCQFSSERAEPGYDFTSSVSRWGVGDPGLESSSKPMQVNSITVTKLPIFDPNDPDENNALYLWANDFHFYTKDHVVLDQLLFEQTSITTPEQIRESERLLRDRKFTSDARIRVLRECGDAVDLEVVTHEVWTLTPELSYKTAGGDSAFKLGMRDSNFLGSGREFSTSFQKDEDRNSFVFRAQDRNYHGSRKVIDTELANLSDGYRYKLSVGVPFYALDARTAWLSQLSSEKRTVSQYSRGETIAETDVTASDAEFSYGWSNGIVADHVNRLTAGVRHSKRMYEQGNELPLPGVAPVDYDLNYPFVRYEFIENRYARAYNINQIYRTEDLHIGKRFTSSFGYSPGDDSRLVIDGSYSDTLIFSPKVLLQVSMDWTGQRVDETNEWQDSLAHFNVDYHRGQTASRSLYLGLESTFSHNLRNGSQISLGGNNGLRGFDNHYLTGDHSTVLTLEQRLFTKTHLFNLARLGYAAFIDVGTTYGGDRTPLDAASGDVFSDVGFGLRLAPSKSENGQVIHIDVAYPVSGDFQGKSRSLQFTAEVKKSF